ncbi:trigger factor [Roseivirga sp. BDSF3-8]|uniref:trigger factor n=1 Tax=Roseivirga sp. BDSF3-8 TaxID=3241598 RepID=UPI003531FED9
MDINLNKKSNTEATLDVVLKEEDYKPQVEAKLKEYSKKMNLKGFRPGKVPVQVVRRMYGQSVLVEEVNNILNKAVTDYIRENEVKVIGEPLPDLEKAKSIDWENDTEFSFTYEVGLADDFEYDLSENQEVTRYSIKVDDATIDETIDNLRQQYGKMTNPEKSEESDLLYGELIEKDGEFNTNTLLNISKAEMKEQGKFIGVSKDDVIEFDLRKAFKSDEDVAALTNKQDDEVSDLKGTFTFQVENINRTEPADLDQEFFDKILGPGTAVTEQEFKEKVKEILESNYSKETEGYLEYKIREKMVDSTEMELPKDFLKKWLLATNEGKITEEDIDKDFDLYVKDLKWTLIRNKIADDYEVKVEHEDVMEKAKDMIRQQLGGMANPAMEANMDAFADNYLKGEDGQNYMRVFNEARTEKVFELIKEKVKINEKDVTAEEFQKEAAN